MSHFTVLVCGSDVDALLQPFHQFECTGTDDQYVQDIDVTDECREHGLDWHGLDENPVTNETLADRSDKHKYGYAVVDASGNLIKAVRRTNPRKKWDWWTVGGRWSGLLKLKPGAQGLRGEPGLMGSHANAGEGYADVALKRDVDFDGMRADASREAAERYDKAAAVIAGRTWLSWEQMREQHASDIDAARKAYWAQPVVADLREKGDFDGWVFDPEEFRASREEYIKRAADKAICTFALLIDGEWYERGEMGWWATVSNEKGPGKWEDEFASRLAQLPDDTVLTVVDCHI